MILFAYLNIIPRQVQYILDSNLSKSKSIVNHLNLYYYRHPYLYPAVIQEAALLAKEEMDADAFSLIHRVEPYLLRRIEMGSWGSGLKLKRTSESCAVNCKPGLSAACNTNIQI